MKEISVDIERVILEAAEGNVRDVQRLGPLIERALARLLERQDFASRLAHADRARVSANVAAGLNDSDEQFVEGVARAIYQALTRGK